MAKAAEKVPVKSYWEEAGFEFDNTVKVATKVGKSLRDRFTDAIDVQIALVPAEVTENDPARWFIQTEDKAAYRLTVLVGNSKLTEKPIRLKNLKEVGDALAKIKADTQAGKLDAELKQVAQSRKDAGNAIRYSKTLDKAGKKAFKKLSKEERKEAVNEWLAKKPA